MKIGSQTVSNHEDEDNDNVKKKNGFMSKPAAARASRFLVHFFLPPLHDYDVKPSNATFYTGREHTTTNSRFFI